MYFNSSFLAVSKYKILWKIKFGYSKIKTTTQKNKFLILAGLLRYFIFGYYDMAILALGLR